MQIKYEVEISKDAVIVNLKRLTNQIYKLLPSREEGLDWTKPLSSIIEEVAGIHSLFYNKQECLFKLLSKLEGLYSLTNEDDFLLYRSIIFECLSLLGEMVKVCQDSLI